MVANVDYEILEADDKDALAKLVIDRLVTGWKMVAGPSVSTCIDDEGIIHHTYIQGMVLTIQHPQQVAVPVSIPRPL
jgi:hypothetical protein